MNHLPALLDHVPPALLVIARIGGLMIFGPVFSARMIPGRVKVFLAVVVGLAVYPVVAVRTPGAGPLSLDLWSLGPMVAMELAIGMVIGYLASLPLLAVTTGGLVMSQQMGLGFARFFNPAMDDDADVIGQVLFFVALAGFLVIGGHEAMLLAVLDSFRHIELGGFVADADLLRLITGMLVAALELALRVAAPVLALVFLPSVAMGCIA